VFEELAGRAPSPEDWLEVRDAGSGARHSLRYTCRPRKSLTVRATRPLQPRGDLPLEHRLESPSNRHLLHLGTPLFAGRPLGASRGCGVL
jgi:hypothetical protein